MSHTAVAVRAPLHYTSSSSSPSSPHKHSTTRDVVPPSNNWLGGIWYMTHTSHPEWQGARNVAVTLTLLDLNARGVQDMDEVIRYQKTGSSEAKELRRINTPQPRRPGSWDQCARRACAVLSRCQWEILGWGNVDPDHRWFIRFSLKKKTASRHCRTAASIEILSRHRQGLPRVVVESILEALNSLQQPVPDLVGSLRQLPCDTNS